VEEVKESTEQAKEFVEDKAAALSSQVESAVSPPPSSEPLIVQTAPADLSIPTSPVVDATTVVPEGTHFYDDIFTGTLDLTSLSGAWGPHPIMRLQSLFLHLHESFPFLGHGLTWAVLIPTVTIGLRFLLFPFQARAQANAARMAIIQPQMLKGMNKLKEAKARGDHMAMQAAQIETQQLMKENNVNPIRNLVFPLAQASVFMVMFFALRGLANAGLPSMATEGLGWVQDLTASDPYYILPVTSTALTLATLEERLPCTWFLLPSILIFAFPCRLVSTRPLPFRPAPPRT
jgi:YidC/Oxa1 family membrane protein insertase